MGIPGGPPNPYILHADTLRGAFVSHSVSEFENEVNVPRFTGLLAQAPNARRILDVGCGPAFPDYIRQAHPYAEILGVDSVTEMLPSPRPDDPKTRFATWQGPVMRHDERSRFIQRFGRFDLIVLKLSAHYFYPSVIFSDIFRLLAPGGSVAMSVPHPDDSARFVARPDLESPYVRGIGSTGIEAEMIHNPTGHDPWRDWYALTSRLPKRYRMIIDEPSTADGAKKRLNILFRPPTRPEKIADVLLKLVGKRSPKVKSLSQAAFQAAGVNRVQ